jgi:hypothetical protein
MQILYNFYDYIMIKSKIKYIKETIHQTLRLYDDIILLFVRFFNIELPEPSVFAL